MPRASFYQVKPCNNHASGIKVGIATGNEKEWVQNGIVDCRALLYKSDVLTVFRLDNKISFYVNDELKVTSVLKGKYDWVKPFIDLGMDDGELVFVDAPTQ